MSPGLQTNTFSLNSEEKIRLFHFTLMYEDLQVQEIKKNLGASGPEDLPQISEYQGWGAGCLHI